MQILGLNGNSRQRIVPMNEVRNWITEGWEFVNVPILFAKVVFKDFKRGSRRGILATLKVRSTSEKEVICFSAGHSE